jgi:hypothetical protein
MNRFVTACAIASTLFFAQSCASPVKSGDSATENHQMSDRTGHDMGQMASGNSVPIKSGEASTQTKQMPHGTGQMSPGHSGAGSHGSHSHGTETSETTRAKLTVPAKISPNQPVSLTIDIQDKAGKAVTKFETFQEKLMHLIVVSDDLQFFDHIHPDYKENGRFEVTTKFPKPGNYTLFSDYKPTAQAEQVSVMKAAIPGGKLTTAPTVDTSFTKTFGKTKVALTFDKPTLKAGEDVMVMFDLQDAASNKSVTDLQPYLGETGHLVIVKQSPSLTRADYIHAHAHQMQGVAANQVHFMTQFPKPGKYKLWGQFNRNGEIITADFWVNVL